MESEPLTAVAALTNSAMPSLLSMLELINISGAVGCKQK